MGARRKETDARPAANARRRQDSGIAKGEGKEGARQVCRVSKALRSGRRPANGRVVRSRVAWTGGPSWRSLASRAHAVQQERSKPSIQPTHFRLTILGKANRFGRLDRWRCALSNTSWRNGSHNAPSRRAVVMAAVVLVGLDRVRGGDGLLVVCRQLLDGRNLLMMAEARIEAQTLIGALPHTHTISQAGVAPLRPRPASSHRGRTSDRRLSCRKERGPSAFSSVSQASSPVRPITPLPC